MPLARTGYRLNFEDISPGKPELGSISMLPWDAAIFGFPVATYRVGTETLSPSARRKFVNRFQRWAAERRVSLCASTIPANPSQSLWKRNLEDAGFRFVDLSVQATLVGLQTASFPKPRTELRLACSDDYAKIEAISAQSFHHGRYHSDSLFPKELADKRYCEWVKNALSGENPIDRVFVMGSPGSVKGFFHVTVEDDVSDLRLAAVEPRLKGTLFGFDLYVSVLKSLRELGVRKVITSISATNTAVVNVYAKLGFAFSMPEMIFHWHGQALNGDDPEIPPSI